MNIFERTSVLKTNKMWAKAIGFLLLLSVMLLLVKPVMADVVNINKASAEALQQNLDGIGPVKAEAIVKYRKKHGSFKSVNDLGKVPGIGKETLLKNKKSLSTSRGLVKATENKLKNSGEKDKKALANKTKSKTDLIDKKSAKGKSEKSKQKLKADKKMNEDKLSKKAKANKKSLKGKTDEEIKKEKLKKAKAKKAKKAKAKAKKAKAKKAKAEAKAKLKKSKKGE